MLEVYQTLNIELEDKLKKLLDRQICSNYRILKSQNGKPYVEGDPVYFSISHSGVLAVIAICDEPVGIDLEIIKERRISSVLSSFHISERGEIKDDKVEFLKKWTVKEAYIKMLGGTLAKMLKSTAYYGGKLYFNGEPVNCGISTQVRDGGVISICTQSPSPLGDGGLKILRI